MASPTSSTRSSAGERVPPRRGADGRSPARTCATTCGSPSRRRSRGPRRRSNSPHSSAARRAPAAARRRAPSRRPARSATAEVRSARFARRCSARWSTSAPARAAMARARSSRRAATRARARAARSASGPSASRSRPGIDEGHQIRLSNEGEVGPRGGPPGSLYVAVHVQPHKSLTREGTELFYDGGRLDRAGGPRDADHGPDRRRRGGGRDQAGDPAGHRDPAARQGRAAPAARGPARRPARDGRCRGADQALEEGPRAADGLRRGDRTSRSGTAAACSRSSGCS